MLKKEEIKSIITLTKIKHKKDCKIKSCKLFVTCDRKQEKGSVSGRPIKCIKFIDPWE
jgi:hypothetical protein